MSGFSNTLPCTIIYMVSDPGGGQDNDCIGKSAPKFGWLIRGVHITDISKP